MVRGSLMLRDSSNKATSQFSASLRSAVSFLVPQMPSYGSAGVPAMPATISMSASVLNFSSVARAVSKWVWESLKPTTEPRIRGV